jgi:hypothetical protein
MIKENSLVSVEQYGWHFGMYIVCVLCLTIQGVIHGEDPVESSQEAVQHFSNAKSIYFDRKESFDGIATQEPLESLETVLSQLKHFQGSKIPDVPRPKTKSEIREIRNTYNTIKETTRIVGDKSPRYHGKAPPKLPKLPRPRPIVSKSINDKQDKKSKIYSPDNGNAGMYIYRANRKVQDKSDQTKAFEEAKAKHPLTTYQFPMSALEHNVGSEAAKEFVGFIKDYVTLFDDLGRKAMLATNLFMMKMCELLNPDTNAAPIGQARRILHRTLLNTVFNDLETNSYGRELRDKLLRFLYHGEVGGILKAREAYVKM